MDSTRVTSGVLKAAAARAKGASATNATNANALVDSRKRKRGALQDISNSHTRGANANITNAKLSGNANTNDATVKKAGLLGGGGVTKPSATATVATRGVKRSASNMSQLPSTATTTTTTANVRARGVRATGAHAATTASTQRRRENAADDSTTSGKVQTRLLSFKSITTSAASMKTTKSTTTTTQPALKRQKTVAPPAMAASQDVEMECTETLKTETSQPEPTPTITVAAPPTEEEPKTEMKHEIKEELQVPKSEPVVAVACPTGEVPPYEPRPYLFTFDHRDSGFDEETYRSQIRDIDAPFKDTAIYCVKLARDMDRFHFQHEEKYRPATDYIGTVQPDINEKMRTILIDWLVEVGEEYELDSQTFHKTVNLVDRCLATFKINRKQFQLLGCACMMIAAKFEEVYGPNVDEFVYISDQTYTSEEMLEMEGKVLQALEYRVASTTCHGFLPRFTRAGCNTDKQRFLVQYLCDFAMLYYHMLEYRPSMIAAAAVYLSRLMTNEAELWTPTLHHFTRFNAWELKACVLDLNRLHLAECQLTETQRDKAKAVSEKYMSEKFLGVSATPSVDEAVLEQSFLAYEQPLQMRRAIKQESSSPDSSGSED